MITQEIDRAAAVLRGGGLVAFPTETVYGLGALAFDADAVAGVFALKGRPAHNPLIVHVLDTTMARTACAAWPERAERLAEAFWPGPLTLVLAASSRVPESVRAGGPTVAVRAPDHAVARALLRTVGEPLVGPSANPSGALSPTSADMVRSLFGARAPLVLDGGPCRTGVESTVLRVGNAGERPRVLRPGPIGHEALSEALGICVEPWRPSAAHSARETPAESPAENPAESPGMAGPHYRPRTPVRLSTDGATLARRDAAALVLEAAVRAGAERTIVMPADARTYASRLYAALREADGMDAAVIVVQTPPTAGVDAAETALWRAIGERLSRAASPERG